MEFTFNPNSDLADVAYNTGVRVTNNAADSLDAWITAGVAFKSESPKRRKEYARFAVSHPEIDMTADSYDKRLGESVKLARKFDTVEGVESAIDAYNDERENNGQSRSFSLQIIAAALCGKGHKADKKVAKEAAQTDTDSVETVTTSGDKVTAALSIVASMDDDELAFFLLGAHSIADKRQTVNV